MSLHASVLLLQGDVTLRMVEVFEAFSYKPVQSRRIQGWLNVLNELQYPRTDSPREHVHKAVTVYKGWTVVLDPELILAAEEKICSSLAELLKVSIFGMLCEGISGSYGFWLYQPQLRRGYLRVDGTVEQDIGSPIPEEGGVDLAHLFEDDVLLIMRRLGVSFQELELVEDYEVWTLDTSHFIPPVAAGPSRQPKPGWKVWFERFVKRSAKTR